MSHRTDTDPNAPPGATLRALRAARGWSLRRAAELASRPGFDLTYSAIHRIESNQGYTSKSLSALAAIYKVDVPSLFLPAELRGLAELPAETRQRITEQIAETAALYRATRKK
jgi:transcriptional regulator with XRE-family HTH domain